MVTLECKALIGYLNDVCLYKHTQPLIISIVAVLKQQLYSCSAASFELTAGKVV
jgi:hypothetical protein